MIRAKVQAKYAFTSLKTGRLYRQLRPWSAEYRSSKEVRPGKHEVEPDRIVRYSRKPCRRTWTASILAPPNGLENVSAKVDLWTGCRCGRTYTPAGQSPTCTESLSRACKRRNFLAGCKIKRPGCAPGLVV